MRVRSVSRDAQGAVEGPIEDARQVLRGRRSGLQCVLGVRGRDGTHVRRNAWTRWASAGVDVEGETRKEECNDETMCPGRLADGEGEPVVVVGAEDDMVAMGEITISLLQ